MGPRSLDRGNRIRGGSYRNSGGSSMGPRSLDRGNEVSKIKIFARLFLQWGRDLSIAEIQNEVTASLIDKFLQWGRDLSIAEIQNEVTASLIDKFLQWGRDLSIAEI